MRNLAYASWRGGKIDLMAMDPETDKPGHVCEIDWGNRYGSPENRPDEIARFVERNNKDALPYILTNSIARPGMMRTIDLTLAPLSLYCYWLDRDPTLWSFHHKRVE